MPAATISIVITPRGHWPIMAIGITAKSWSRVHPYHFGRCLITKGLDNPYVELASGSNGHRHRRYIEFGPLLENPIDGVFDQFGLSKTATVPWF